VCRSVQLCCSFAQQYINVVQSVEQFYFCDKPFATLKHLNMLYEEDNSAEVGVFDTIAGRRHVWNSSEMDGILSQLTLHEGCISSRFLALPACVLSDLSSQDKPGFRFTSLKVGLEYVRDNPTVGIGCFQIASSWIPCLVMSNASALTPEKHLTCYYMHAERSLPLESWLMSLSTGRSSQNYRIPVFSKCLSLL
jgi:hypothetical protein